MTDTSKRSSKTGPRLTRGLDPTTFTPHFEYRRSERGTSVGDVEQLFCEGVLLETIANTVGTPTYVYSRKSIAEAYQRLDRALGSLPHSICYAVKANANLSVLRLLAELGSSFDVVSADEIERLRQVGVRGRLIVFSGVGKSRAEIRTALRYRVGESDSPGILLFNIESEAELEVLLSEASKLRLGEKTRPSAAIRINPDVRAGGHPHISTGYRQHKFGIDWKDARRLYAAHKSSKWIRWRGISAHIGSQIVTLDPFRTALTRLATCVRELASKGIPLEYLDFGGGLGIQYTNERVPSTTEYARTLTKIVRPLGCRLLLEPGRSIVGPAGVLLARVLYTKENGGKTFVIVDAGMNDLIRPALYDATHVITQATRDKQGLEPTKTVDVVGPVCETGDYLGRDVTVGDIKRDELLAVWSAGAYGFSESSNYNARPRAAEVLVEGQRYRVIRARESVRDLWRGEP